MKRQTKLRNRGIYFHAITFALKRLWDKRVLALSLLLGMLIAVLQDGKIIEYDSHENLIQLGGVYAELYNKQAGQYK